jgi:hypothetical protein
VTANVGPWAGFSDILSTYFYFYALYSIFVCL